MLKISREVELGLLLVVELARKPKQILSLKEWAEKRGLPYRFLSKVAVKLKKAKILISKEGRAGGYLLANTASKIKVGEVVRVFQGPVKAVRCLSGGKCGCESFCGHKDLMESLSLVVEKQLDKVSVKDLC